MALKLINWQTEFKINVYTDIPAMHKYILVVTFPLIHYSY